MRAPIPAVTALGYVRVESQRLDDWRAFGAEVLGAQPASDGGDLWLRIDERPYRVAVTPGEQERLHSVGWEVPDAQALAEVEARLLSAGVAVERATSGEAFRRRVGELIHLADPSGNRLELFHSPILSDSRFVSPVGVSAFVTGD